LGKPVRASSFKLCHGCGRELGLVCIARVTLRFGECLVTKHCHDLMRRASGLGEIAPEVTGHGLLGLLQQREKFDRITYAQSELFWV
jgi:hypothetical protein